ncbi:hypothetical protein [Helicobacter suis]|uniref:hypothetical protein n=1 Tax=Helicobacter suis TaxID=104628 RepID=UPI0013D3AABE|nr:hypothetical protein [Helicobacter suis]
MSISKALQKLDDRISGLNTMRGRLIKFVNPQTTQTPAPEVSGVANTSAQVDSQTKAPTQSTAPETTQNAPTQSGLSDSERQERLNLINRLIVTRNITNDDLAPLGLHFENIEPFNGIVWDSQQENMAFTTAFKDYMRGMDSVSALAVMYDAMKFSTI